MDALSAIRLYPNANPQGLAAQPGAGVVGRISARELGELPGTLGTREVEGTSSSGASFGQVLGNLIQDVNSKQIASKEAVQGLLNGENVSLHQAVIAMEEAGVAFQLMVEVRNKLLESYQELMRMQM